MEEIKFKKQMENLLEEYGGEIEEALGEAIEETAKNAVKKLKSKKTFAPKSKATGNYAKGWKADIEKKRLQITARIHNAKFPARVHLLENGHVTRNGNGREYPRTPAYPHVAPVAEEAGKELVKLVEEKVTK